MSTRADEHRLRAAQCQERAKEARDPEVRSKFKELARQWLEMANQVDRQKWLAAVPPAAIQLCGSRRPLVGVHAVQGGADPSRRKVGFYVTGAFADRP